MLSRWKWVVVRFSRRLWVRASLFALVGILTALAAIVLAPFLPLDWANKIGADAVGNILDILASSMLVVATFSLSTMVAAYNAAAAGTTPRVVQLLVADTRAQNAIATFIGGFLFSLVGIIALSSEIYGPSGRIVLFFVTIVVAGFIVLTFIRSIDYVLRLGRVADAIERVAVAAVKAMNDRHDHPWLGVRAQQGPSLAKHAIVPSGIGYVTYLDMAALEEVAQRTGTEIQVAALPGAFVDPSRPLAWTTVALDEAGSREVEQAFSLGSSRSFDQDPRFGVVVLAEIASKALSPGVNDPGTAIGVITTLVRVLATWTRPASPSEIRFPHVVVPTIAVDELFDDAFTAVGQDAAGSLTVGIKLQKALVTLAALGRHDFREAARHQSRLALARAGRKLVLPEDVDQLAAVAGLLANDDVPAGPAAAGHAAPAGCSRHSARQDP
ncbi:MAG TPA: DUF2254 domain-containing protein [Geminicoccus sp.]|jgi:uncharacterized membrane protein|uniref:DUF2254 domain-containing protein n=1 Tax=Geminicoccus sp. TaxID=2024832 RepID=UPI002E339A46|nr:DUF2254 domain-containing protein [Geminicoccus sp.]HEX2527349.1 DUF2254 domain-containing protein [Geminicoccus sp.]